MLVVDHWLNLNIHKLRKNLLFQFHYDYIQEQKRPKNLDFEFHVYHYYEILA